jgi:hypothetical protein
MGSRNAHGCAQNAENSFSFELFLERYHRDGNEFLNLIIRVTGDETWALFVNVETKRQSKQCMHRHSPNNPKKFKQTSACQKADASCFLRQERGKGVLMVEFMRQGTTVTSDVYCKTLKELCRAIQNKRRGMLTSGVVLLDENTRPHTAACTRALRNISNESCLTTLHNSPHLAPSDYHLFTYQKNWLRSQRFNNNEEMIEGVKTWLSSQEADFFDTGIHKRIP